MAEQQQGMTVNWQTRGDMVGVLDRSGISLVLSTFPNLVVFLGARDGALTFHAAPVAQSLGLAVEPGRIAVAAERAITIYANVPRLAPHYPARPGVHDAFFVPRTLHFVGQTKMHDMVFDGAGLIATNTHFSCLCRVDGESSFTPLWRPPFISRLHPEDRCHLNGFAAEGTTPRYATALAATDTPEGWRGLADSQGILIDIAANRILRDDLCMPHSPRLVEDQLYVLNSGEGEVLRVDRGTGASEVVARLPAFTHGLQAWDGVLFAGMSRNRASRKANPPPIARRVPELLAGVAAIDAASGRILGTMEFDQAVTEVYDVQVLPGIRQAGMQNMLAPDGCEAIDMSDGAFWMPRPNNDLSHFSSLASTNLYRLRPADE